MFAQDNGEMPKELQHMDVDKHKNANFTTKILSSSDAASERLVIVRYYLDRPGYDINHSSARIWKDPPPTCYAVDVQDFLARQGITTREDGIIAEIYLDKFKSYMLLQALGDDIVLDFGASSADNPGILNIRLTDMQATLVDDRTMMVATTPAVGSEQKHPPPAAARRPQNCNMGPAGLFAFSLTVGLETAELTGRLVPNFVEPSFVLTYATYAFFVSGLLQLLVGMWEVTRNNIYGATAFSLFGCFWLANGLKLILVNYFGANIPEELLGPDDWGNFIRNLYILGFTSVLFKQTLIMNRVTTTLITLLCLLVLFIALSGWSEVIEWFQMVFGWCVSAFAFFTFTAEMTNEVYQRQVFNLYPWVADSPDEVFGAAGKANSLYSKAARLRSASVHASSLGAAAATATPSSAGVQQPSRNVTNQHSVRSVLPVIEGKSEVDVKVE